MCCTSIGFASGNTSQAPCVFFCFFTRLKWKMITFDALRTCCKCTINAIGAFSMHLMCSYSVSLQCEATLMLQCEHFHPFPIVTILCGIDKCWGSVKNVTNPPIFNACVSLGFPASNWHVRRLWMALSGASSHSFGTAVERFAEDSCASSGLFSGPNQARNLGLIRP